jgi:hypothetical protein
MFVMLKIHALGPTSRTEQGLGAWPRVLKFYLENKFIYIYIYITKN